MAYTIVQPKEYIILFQYADRLNQNYEPNWCVQIVFGVMYCILFCYHSIYIVYI